MSEPVVRSWHLVRGARPVDLDAVAEIVRLGRAGVFGPEELRARLRQVIG